jgi:hypothetical protein
MIVIVNVNGFCKHNNITVQSVHNILPDKNENILSSMYLTLKAPL